MCVSGSDSYALLFFLFGNPFLRRRKWCNVIRTNVRRALVCKIYNPHISSGRSQGCNLQAEQLGPWSPYSSVLDTSSHQARIDSGRAAQDIRADSKVCKLRPWTTVYRAGCINTDKNTPSVLVIGSGSATCFDCCCPGPGSWTCWIREPNFHLLWQKKNYFSNFLDPETGLQWLRTLFLLLGLYRRNFREYGVRVSSTFWNKVTPLLGLLLFSDLQLWP